VTEDEHQELIFEWVDSHLDTYPLLKLLYANMNGVRRSKRYTAKLKRRGLKSGIPDMFLPVARHGFHGLYIELKRPKTKDHNAGIMSTSQKMWNRELMDQGYACMIAYGHQEVISLFEHYFAEPEGSNDYS